MRIVTRNFFSLLGMFILSGCATNFEPPPLSAGHPASAQAQEMPRVGKQRLIVTDAITRKTIAQLERKDAPTPDFENGEMSHDMSMGGMDHTQMKGMDHSKMQGMDANKQPSSAPTPPAEEMDHSKMPGMMMPAPAPTGSPANKGAAEMEMKKTADEMKRLSDEMKAKSDAENATKKTPPKPSRGQQTETAYWTCVMHPEIHEEKPGQCPKCGMPLVKKEGAPE